MDNIYDTKIKKNKESANKSVISRFINNTDWDKKIQKIGSKSRIKSRARLKSKTANALFKLFSW